ncbi:DUF1266 domain-containing protein [Streptomyces sp. NPDC020096]
MNTAGTARAFGGMWQPPTEVERLLYEAKCRGDADGFLAILACFAMFVDVLKVHADADLDSITFVPHWDPAGRLCVALRTRGELPPRRPDHVVSPTNLRLLAEAWPDDNAWLVVNPGTPGEMYFPARPADRRRWKRIAKHAPRPVHGDAELLTKFTGPLHGPLAHALACGAHLAVHQQALWNDLGDVYDSYPGDVEALRDPWNVADRDEWHRQLDYLLKGVHTAPEPKFVLRIRAELAQAHGAPPPVDVWHRSAEATLRHSGTREPEIAAVLSLIGRVLRYEARFQADGLLPPYGFVRSVNGYDYGRAINFIRRGLGARLCEPAEAEQAVLRAGQLCRETYASWDEFSAGYTLGSVLRSDEGQFGHAYDSVLDPHRILTRDPASPWRNIPWRAS